MSRKTTAALVLAGLLAGLGGGALNDYLRPGPIATVQVPEERTGPLDRRVMLALVRSTLTAVDQAGRTGNYAVLRALGSPAFAKANPEDRLARIFAVQRARAPDLTGVLFTEPTLAAAPSLEANGMLRITGFFPAGKAKLDFDLLYEPVDSQWRLFGVSTGARAPERLASAAGP